MIGPSAKKPIVILDTGIACAVAFNPRGVSENLIKLMEDGAITVVMSNRLRAEYDKTLSHPVQAKRFPFLTTAYIEAFLDRFDTSAERIPNPPTVFAYSRDPNDEPLMNLAVAIQADYLVTLDKDLLLLPNYPDFARLPNPPRALKPGAFLAELTLIL